MGTAQSFARVAIALVLISNANTVQQNEIRETYSGAPTIAKTDLEIVA